MVRHPLRGLNPAIVTLATLALIGFCGPLDGAQAANPPVAPAAWRVDEADPPTSASTQFVAQVTRLHCNGGITGQPQPPVVVVESDRIVVTFSVTPPASDLPSTCQANDWVNFVVELNQPIGQRQLVDSSCFEQGAAFGTSLCEDAGVCWRPAVPDPVPAPPVVVHPTFTG